TANERTVALWVAAFTGAEGNPRHGAQGILQRGGGGVLEDLLWHHGDRARGVYQRRGVFLRRGFFDLVGRAVLFLAGDAGGPQGNAVALAFLPGFFGCLRHLGGSAGTDGNANGRSQQTR